MNLYFSRRYGPVAWVTGLASRIRAGWPRRLPSLNYRLVRWRDPEVAARHHHSFSAYEVELHADREQPQPPKGLFGMFVKGNEREGVGTVPGTWIEVVFDPLYVSRDEIQDYVTRLPAELEPIPEHEASRRA